MRTKIDYRAQRSDEATEQGTAHRSGPHGRSKRAFVRHYLEMVAAMIVGMMVLEPVRDVVVDALGWSAAFDGSEVRALAMATEMTIAMVAWMRYRRHAWPTTAEMALAMYVPFVLLFVPLWLGVIAGDAVLAGGHVLMLPAMALVMLRRLDEYARSHSNHAVPSEAPDHRRGDQRRMSLLIRSRSRGRSVANGS